MTMWYLRRALRYFLPHGEKRKPLIFGPSFWKAEFGGAKKVPPVCSWGISEVRLVRWTARRKVLNSDGKKWIIRPAEGGGIRMESTAWITPLVAKIFPATTWL